MYKCVLFMSTMTCANKKGMEENSTQKVKRVGVLWNTINRQVFKLLIKIFIFFKSTVGFVLNFNQPYSTSWKNIL